MKDWKFELGQEVSMCLSGEYGTVIGRAEYVNGEDAFYLRYVTGDGRQVDDWVLASAIVANP